MEKYRRIRLLGQGACTKCFLVEDEESGEHYCVKQIENSLSGQERERALREAALLRVLSHPNIIGYREAFVTRSGHICLIMEYADGGDLNQYVQQHRLHGNGALLPEAQVLHWCAQLTSALQYLHSRHVLHRDIKAGNIFLRKGGTAQLGDFGISTVLDSESGGSVSSAIGTPCYASPERVMRRPYNAPADIWSLGIVLYELCALRRPFWGESIGALAERIVMGEYTSLDERWYSAAIRGLVDRMLTYDPGERPTATEVLELPVVREREVWSSHPPLSGLASATSSAHTSCSMSMECCPGVPEHSARGCGDRGGVARDDQISLHEASTRSHGSESLETLHLPSPAEATSPSPAPCRNFRQPSAPPTTTAIEELEQQVPEVELLLDEVMSNVTVEGQDSPHSPIAAWPLDRGTPDASRAPRIAQSLLHGARRLFGLHGA